MRLALVGSEGQGRIAAASVVVGASGDEGLVAARYLAGAGVGRITVTDAAIAAGARAIDAEIAVDEGAIEDASPMADLDGLDPAARAVARGARRAVRALVAVLGAERGRS